jgi:hypothetical protein
MLTFAQFVFNEEYVHLDTSLGLPRTDMPQVAQKDHPNFMSFLKGRGVDHEKISIPARSLKPTQREIDWKKVSGLGNIVHDKPLIVSSDNFVADGHHRWANAALNHQHVSCLKANLPILQLIKVMSEFPKAFFAALSTKEQGA